MVTDLMLLRTCRVAHNVQRRMRSNRQPDVQPICERLRNALKAKRLLVEGSAAFNISNKDRQVIKGRHGLRSIIARQ